jgi:RimJ/RimL family protein N-acetyltransferase
MIGDTGMRGKGVGTAAFRAVMRWLQTEHDDTALYTRHLAANEGAGKLIYNLGFTDDGETYTDEDGLVWQNAKYVRTND